MNCELPLSLVCGVILSAAHFPQVRAHGAFAGGGVTLRGESLLVLRHLVEVLGAELDGLCHLGEAQTSCLLVGGERM